MLQINGFGSLFNRPRLPELNKKSGGISKTNLWHFHSMFL